MFVYKKADSYQEANRIKEFINFKGHGAEVKRNQDGGHASHKVVGNDRAVVALMDRHGGSVDVFRDDPVQKATWEKPKEEWTP